MITIVNFRQYERKDGLLIPIELQYELPFQPKRLFYIRNVPVGTFRANHAHRECHQIFICIAGTFDVLTQDGDGEVYGWDMDTDSKGLHVPPLTWVVVKNIAPGAVILVLASHEYDVKDYIDDHDEYMNLWQKSQL